VGERERAYDGVWLKASFVGHAGPRTLLALQRPPGAVTFHSNKCD
jgi:hypothetical protein